MRLLLVGLVLGAPVAWGQTCADTGGPCDQDEDGYSILDGDCDDADATRHPGADEICDDGVDQDCDGEDDAGCDIRDAELLGGTGCGARGGWTALLLPLPLIARRRRS